MINLQGQVALITGAARGQGRAHAIELARYGAAIIAVDINDAVETVPYRPATLEDMNETVRAVTAVGGRIVAATADVRSRSELTAAVATGVETLGGLDIVVANAGIVNAVQPSWELSENDWATMLDVNLTGVWHTTSVAIPHLITRGGGSIITISSTAGLRGIPNISHYNAAKHGVVGLTRTLANELAPHRIRVNSIHPTNVLTAMLDNNATARVFRPDLDAPTLADASEVLSRINMWDRPWVEVADISNAVLFLASDMSRYVTGVALPVDLGMSQKYSGS